MSDQAAKKFKPFVGEAWLKSKRTVLDSFFKVEAVKVAYARFLGKGVVEPPYEILCLERGDSVAALIHDTVNGTVVLAEQFRYPTLKKSGGWILEVPAGMFKEGEEPLEAIRREVVEEVGYKAHVATRIATFYVSPGGTSERIWLYYLPVVPQDLTAEGGGLESESETILRHELDIDEVFGLMAEGKITDGKTLVALLWLQNQLLTGKILKKSS